MKENKYTVKVTPKAYEDMDRIYGYITNELHNQSAADDLLMKIETGILRLRIFPFSCSFVKDEMLKEKGYRKLTVENYIVFHLVRKDEKEVIVMRVLYGKQKFQDLI
ncbi:type II toxin-antitoxin system RelE/ParE family toxin [Aquibacillus sp. 3ASR75-11]|uniref:Type II toxin-antitoxin system RelE/ParE family toxin n=1 Tax=Terrihalobacillus insolitus TaxID=2950438 RepID=A0A9X4AKV7_9BACI|nr:type II toxin-antitoxin system RelE/ParE family toxin [Terrihalobacillus insolitus]MDC3412073.1 type II toxin-antitoxin system RelE/ParE family toxin [Terrihalobacillus insolitus]MDC3423234.1 type II toxin-antitoxin system RelE/ParE family toxin [Terrihalobacillus insolitus]